MPKAGRVHSTPQRIASKSPPIRETAAVPDAELIRTCITYVQSAVAWNIGFDVDETGDNEFAQEVGDKYRRARNRAAIDATELTPQTWFGLFAKARLASVLLDDVVNSRNAINAHEVSYLVAFARDVERLTKDAIRAGWEAEKARDAA